MKTITQDWLISAKSDLDINQHIIPYNDLTHQVAFHAQQAIEKCLKAIIEEYELGFIKTHSIQTLLGIVENKIDLKIEADLSLLLDQLYIDARYPGEMGLLPNGKPTIQDAESFLQLAFNVYNTTINFLNNNEEYITKITT